jgi:translation initiation factor eIF-2B subunit alpha
MGLQIELKAASDLLQSAHSGSISLAAGCALFERYVYKVNVDRDATVDASGAIKFDTMRQHILEAGRAFSEYSKSEQAISSLLSSFISDGKTLLVHGSSRIVLACLKRAGDEGHKFVSCFSAESESVCACVPVFVFALSLRRL